MRVVVVGAGVIGCAVAFECARRGARVTVLDPRAPGHGATQASAGMLAPYVEGHSPVLRHLCADGLAAWPPFLAALGPEALPSDAFRRDGSLQVAFDDNGARELMTLAGQLDAAQVQHRLLTGQAARAIEPGLSAEATMALEIPEHGHVRPMDLVRALVAQATTSGVRFHGEPVVGVDGGASVAQACTPSATFDAEAVVVSAGSWSGTLLGAKAPVPVKPIRGQLLQVRLAARVASRVVWGPECYVVPHADGSALVGATSEDVGFDERATLGGVRRLSSAAATLFPGLEEATLEGVRVGLRPATPDELPLVGPSATMPQVFYALGHYRNGVLLAPLTAQLVADLVLDGRSSPHLETLTPGRFGL